MIRAGQRKAGFEFETDLSSTDYAAIARGFGCAGYSVETEQQFRDALCDAFSCEKPALIDCRTTFQPHLAKRYFGAAGAARSAADTLPF